MDAGRPRTFLRDADLQIHPDAGDVRQLDAGAADAGLTTPPCVPPPGPFPAPGARVEGEKAPPFTLRQCDGSEFVLFDEALCDTKFTVVNFAAGWCPPCIEEGPRFEGELTQRYAGEVRFVQVLIHTREFLEPATLEFCSRWVSDYGMTNPVVIDAPSPVAMRNYLGSMPTIPAFFVIDPTGVIRAVIKPGSIETVQSTLDRLLLSE